jgi:hypothetical protein
MDRRLACFTDLLCISVYTRRNHELKRLNFTAHTFLQVVSRLDFCNIEVLFMPLVMLVAGSRAMPSVSRSTPVTPLHTHTHTHTHARTHARTHICWSCLQSRKRQASNGKLIISYFVVLEEKVFFTCLCSYCIHSRFVFVLPCGS